MVRLGSALAAVKDDTLLREMYKGWALFRYDAEQCGNVVAQGGYGDRCPLC